MSAHDNTFIDAYGLELTDELEATYAQSTQPSSPKMQGSAQPEEPQTQPRNLRFDAAARRHTLRGPHFDMRRVALQADGDTTAWDAFDSGVIDVGAAWASVPSVTESTGEEEAVVSHEAQIEVLADSKVSKQTASPPAEVVTQVVPTPEIPIDSEQEQTSVDPTLDSRPSTLDSRQPAINTSEPFAPVWEVDRFRWPDEIEELFKAQSDYFDYAGKKLVSASREGLKILAITSTKRGEGSTTLALCLARSAAGAGARVALLDGNLKRSELGEKLGVDFGSGWQSAAAGEQPLAEAAITGLEEGITLFPSTAGSVSDVKSLADERAGQVFRAAAASYDLLIIDAGTADFGKNVETLDAAIVARDVRSTSEEETLAIATALRNCGVKAVGIAENFSISNSQRAAA